MNAHDTGALRGKQCPVCGRPAMRETRPFCSKRCADVDLHRWLSGHYRVPVIEEDGGDGTETEEG